MGSGIECAHVFFNVSVCLEDIFAYFCLLFRAVFGSELHSEDVFIHRAICELLFFFRFESKLSKQVKALLEIGSHSSNFGHRSCL